jgi:glycosyltransferase involved in cell wall biosynthesis
VEALALVRQQLPMAQLHVYGKKTAFLETVMQSVRNRGLEQNVIYLGQKPLEEIARAIAACDVGVIPNHRNAFTDINTPTRIFEYLALGKPVIVPRTPGIQDYFSDDSLLLVEAGNAADIARQIEYVARNYEDAIRVAERGQQIYLQHTWKQERRTLVELVAGLLSGGEAYDRKAILQ